MAEAILRQQKDKEDIATLLKQSKVSLAEKRPVVVSPEEFKNSKQDKKLRTKVVYEESIETMPLAEVRKVGKPQVSHVEEMQTSSPPNYQQTKQ